MSTKIEKTTLSVIMEPAEGDMTSSQIRVEGAADDLLVAYTELTKRFLATLEEKYGKDFVTAAYAITQSIVLKESCMKESFEKHEAEFKRMKPLMDIMGKTFTVPEKEAEAE